MYKKKLIILVLLLFSYRGIYDITFERYIEDIDITPTINTIKLLYSTLIIETVNFDSTAINKTTKAQGILQITDICRREANRIVNKDSFNNVINIRQSFNIWYTIQKYYNPTFDIEIGASIWVSGRKKPICNYGKNYVKKILYLSENY